MQEGHNRTRQVSSYHVHVFICILWYIVRSNMVWYIFFARRALCISSVELGGRSHTKYMTLNTDIWHGIFDHETKEPASCPQQQASISDISSNNCQYGSQFLCWIMNERGWGRDGRSSWAGSGPRMDRACREDRVTRFLNRQLKITQNSNWVINI